jgi:ribosomal protein S18 acetylase RimI-like enzyme
MQSEFVKMLTEQNELMHGNFINKPIEEYVQKILSRANILAYMQRGVISSFIAYYCNDPSFENAFLTMLCVSPEYTRLGLGKLLLQSSIMDLQKRRFSQYFLAVTKDNDVAIQFYSKNGFAIVGEEGNSFKMNKALL